MFYSNTLNLIQVGGGTQVKQGDLGSRFSYKLANEKEQELDNFNEEVAHINLVLNDKIVFTTTATVDNSTVTFNIDKAIPVGLYFLEIKIRDYIFPSDKQTIIFVQSGALAYDLEELVPNYDLNMTLKGILSDLSQKGIDISDLKRRIAEKVNKDEVTNVMTPKGTLAYASLPKSGNQVGWYYYCPDGDGVHGAGNYVWNGTSWFFGGTGDEGYNLLKEDLVNDYYTNDYQFVVGGLSATDGNPEPDVTWAISTTNLISFKENTIIECTDSRYLFHVYYYSSDGTFVKRLTDLKKAEILADDYIKLSLIHSNFSHDSLDLSANNAIKISLSTINNSLKYDNLGLNKIKFTHCNYNSTGLTKESVQHRLSTNIFNLKEDVILTSPANMFFRVFLFNDDNTLKSIIDKTKSVYIPRNTKIRIMYIRDDNNQDTSYLYFSTLSQIEINPIYFVLNNEYKPLNGYWFWGNTNVHGVYESNVKWRFTNVRPIKVDSTVQIKKIDGYIIDLRIFKGDNQVRFDSTDLHEKIYIYPNEVAYINVLRDDKNADNSLLDTDVLTKVMCKAYSADEPSKDMYEYYGINKNDNILKLNKISAIGRDTHSQSICVDTEKNIIYNFGGENYGYNTYNLNGVLIDTKDKAVTGHDNDCVKVNDDFYFTSGENNYITKWNIKTNTSTRIDIQGIENNGNENTIRRISGICMHNSDENELILTTIDLNTTNELINTPGDKVSIYMLNLRDNTAHLLKEFDKDVVYVQGSTMYNDMLYIMCNIQTTGTPSNYKGVNIKCVNLFNNKLVDEINIFGVFENEGLDFAVENNTVYLYTIISHFGVFENLVKFKAPLIN